MAPPINRHGDSELHASPTPGVKLTLTDIRDEMHALFHDQNARLDKALRFIDGDNAEGTNSAKVRLDRIEQRAKFGMIAAGAALTAVVGAGVKWVLSGGIVHPPTGGH